MFDDLNTFVSSGLTVWLKMAVQALLNNYGWIGLGVLLLPLLRKLVSIFRSLY